MKARELNDGLNNGSILSYDNALNQIVEYATCFLFDPSHEYYVEDSQAKADEAMDDFLNLVNSHIIFKDRTFIVNSTFQAWLTDYSNHCEAIAEENELLEEIMNY